MDASRRSLIFFDQWFCRHVCWVELSALFTFLFSVSIFLLIFAFDICRIVFSEMLSIMRLSAAAFFSFKWAGHVKRSMPCPGWDKGTLMDIIRTHVFWRLQVLLKYPAQNNILVRDVTVRVVAHISCKITRRVSQWYPWAAFLLYRNLAVTHDRNQFTRTSHTSRINTISTVLRPGSHNFTVT